MAAATVVKQSQLRAVPEMRDWQAQAWDYFDRVGECRYAAQWIANALSRCHLYVGVPDDDGAGTPEPIGDSEATAGADERARIPLDELFGGTAGHPEMLSRLGLHLTVPGESFIIGWDTLDAGRRWLVASSEEFTRTGSTVKVRLPETDQQVPIVLGQSTVMRLWRPHPRRAWWADSPIRAALPILKELVGLDAHIAATIESRLAGAGVWILPESATLPAPLQQQGEPLHEDPAMATLIDAMVTPIGDRDSAAAVVPIIVRVPDSATGKSEYITFSTPLDQKVKELREASIRRFATVADIPAEVMAGAASSSSGEYTSRYNSFLVEEQAVKIHIEPLLGLICDALTTQYLWPALVALGVADPQQYVIWYDVSNLVLRPNRGPEAQNLYDAGGLVSSKTVRRASGFSEDDAPDEDEQKRILLTQLATKGVDPILAAPYLQALGVELDLDDYQPPQQEPGSESPDRAPETGTRAEGRPPNPTRLPTRNEPGGDQAPTTASISTAAGCPTVRPDFAAIDMAAVRALELAGKRLLNNNNRSWRGVLRRVDPWEIHCQIPVTDPDAALEGAYVLLNKCMPGQRCVHQTVDRYVRERLATQTKHDRSRLMAMLNEAGCLTGSGPRAVA